MKRSILLRFFNALLLLHLSSSNAIALELSPIISLNSGVQYFHYEEFNSNNDRLNKEEGFLPEIKAEASQDVQQWGLSVYGGFIKGRVNYFGQTQAGADHNTTTEQEISHLGFSLLTPTLFSSFYDNRAKFSVERYFWRRDIQPKNNIIRLVEDYQWTLIKGSLSLSPIDNLTLFAGIQYLFDASMFIHDTGCYDSVTVYPKSSFGWLSGIEYQLNSNWKINLDYQYKEMRESEVRFANSCRGRVGWKEPDNQMQTTSLQISYSI